MTHPTLELEKPTPEHRELPTTPELPTKIEGLVIRLLDDDTDDSTIETYYSKLHANSQSLHDGGLYLDESYAGPEDIFDIIGDPNSKQRMYSVNYQGELIGGIDMTQTDHPNEVEIVGWGEKAHQGKGFGTASNEAIVTHYLEQGFDVVSNVIPTNAASARILGKLSFQNNGQTDGRVVFKKPADSTRR